MKRILCLLTSGFLRKSRAAVNVLFCDVGVYDVTYEFHPPSRFVLVEKQLSSNQVAGYSGFTLDNWWAALLPVGETR